MNKDENFYAQTAKFGFIKSESVAECSAMYVTKKTLGTIQCWSSGPRAKSGQQTTHLCLLCMLPFQVGSFHVEDGLAYSRVSFGLNANKRQMA